jgi:hypothetical protein
MAAEVRLHGHPIFSFRLNLFYQQAVVAARDKYSSFVGLQHRPRRGITFLVEDFRTEET